LTRILVYYLKKKYKLIVRRRKVVNLVCEAILPDCPMKDVEEIEKSIVTTYKKS